MTSENHRFTFEKLRLRKIITLLYALRYLLLVITFEIGILERVSNIHLHCCVTHNEIMHDRIFRNSCIVY